MRILHTVEFYDPSVGGAQEVVRQISESLASRGHDVTVATTKIPARKAAVINKVRIEEFAVSGNAVRGIRGEASRYQEFLADSNFDVMLNYAAQQWATDLVFPVLSRLKYSKILVPCGFSALFHPRYADYYRQMPDVLRRYDHLVFHGRKTRDMQFALEQGVPHYSIISNGASRSEFDVARPGFRQRYGIASDVQLLLTVGSHTGQKGHGLVISSFRRAQIGPAVLVIIGNTIGGMGCLYRCRFESFLTRALTRGEKTVMLLNPPRQDVLSAYEAADLFVFGSAIECSPLVLFEAMASGTPFLTLSCGNAAEIVEWSGGGRLVATNQNSNGTVTSDPDAVARSIERTLEDRQGLRTLGASGKQSWLSSFTWDHIALQYERLYERLVESRRHTSVTV